MPDEAILRIVMEGAGGTGPTTTPQRGGGGPPAPPQPPPPFDPVKEALDRIQREQRRMQVEAAYQNITVGPGVALPAEAPPEGGSTLDIIQTVLKQFGGQAGGAAGDVLKAFTGTGAGGAVGGLAAGGAIIAAVVATEVLLRNALESAVHSVTHFAEVLSSPDVDPSVIFSELGQSVRSSTEKLIYLGNLLGVFGPVVGDIISSFGNLQRNLDGMVQRFAGFSPLLASAQAQAEVTQVLGEFRRAQTAAPDLARYIQARTELQQRYEDIKVELLKGIAPVLTTAVETLTAAMPLLRGAVTVLSFIGQQYKPLADKLEEINRKMRPDDLPENFTLPTDALMDQVGYPNLPFGIGGEGPSRPGG